MASSTSPPSFITGAHDAIAPSSPPPFHPPQQLHFRSPQTKRDPRRLEAVASFHLVGDSAKTLARRGAQAAPPLKGDAMSGQWHYDSATSSDDDENVDHSNAQAALIGSPSRSSEDADGETEGDGAASAIAAMSLSFIINGEVKQEAALEHPMEDDDSSSSTTSSSRGGFDLTSMLNTVCAKPDCYRTIRGPSGTFCKYHKQSRFCRADGCAKSAKTGGFCISHGGGKRCAHPDCSKSAKQGGLCISHGGGKRCSEVGCTKSALVGGFCSAHGGGRKCKTPDCTKTALLGGLCIAHGGGKRCQIDGCSKSAVGGTLCVSHGGGKRCQAEGCSKGAVRNGVCIRHGAKRDHASASP